MCAAITATGLFEGLRRGRRPSSTRSTASTSLADAASSSRSWAPPAPARARCCTCSAASSRRRRARSPSRGGRVDGADDRDLPACGAASRVRLPVLQPAAVADRRRERLPAGAHRAATGPDARGARATRSSSASASPTAPTHMPVGALRRRAAARVDRAGAAPAEPEILLADEPTGNLDSRAGGEVLAILRDDRVDDGRTVVMVTHDPGRGAIADRVVFLRDGRIAGEMAAASTRQGRRRAPAALQPATRGHAAGVAACRRRPGPRSTGWPAPAADAAACARC